MKQYNQQLAATSLCDPNHKKVRKPMNTLPSRIHDSTNGLDYTLVGDYYLPDLEIESSQSIGKYGRARMKVL